MESKTYFEEIGYDYDNDRETIIIVDETGNEVVDYNSFKDGDILILENMPYDLWDENSWSFIHATGQAIWSSTRYPSGDWVVEYED